MRNNPPWTNKLLSAHWGSIQMAAGKLHLPLPQYLDLSQSKSHAPKIMASREYGCGHYGCVLSSERPGTVLKITTDATEAHFIAAYLTLSAKGIKPDGMIEYYAIRALPETYRGRPTFIIWREEADTVGLIGPRATNDEHEFGTLLMRFKTIAHEARMYADDFRKDFTGGDPSVEPMDQYWRWLDAQESMGDEMASEYSDHWGEDKSVSGSLTGDGITNALLQRHSGRGGHATRFAWLLECCRQIAVEMEHANQMSTYIGKALGEYIDQGLLLADVHTQNVGTVKREGFRTPIWTITDPGHALTLKKSMSRLEIPKL